MQNPNLPDDLQGLVEYHGHLCFGLLIGYKACKYAVEIIGQSSEMMVLVENSGCDSDAVKFLLNCTTANGKLICRRGDKQSWAFYNREEGEGIRLVPNPHLVRQLPGEKDQALRFLLELPGHLLFMVEPFQCTCPS